MAIIGQIVDFLSIKVIQAVLFKVLYTAFADIRLY